MKLFQKLLLCAVISSYFLASCQKYKEEDFTLTPTLPPTVHLLPSNDALARATKTMVLGLLSLSGDEDFKDWVHSEVQDTFDGDYNVLLKKMSEICNDNERSLANEMESSIDDFLNLGLPSISHEYEEYDILTDAEDIYDILQGFEYQEEIAHLQIYIPFIDEVDLGEIPTICFGHEEKDTTLGYYWDGEDLVAMEVDSNYAKSHLVWVVSVNEVVDEYGEVDFRPYIFGGNTETAEDGSRSLGRAVYHNSFKISNKKEVWSAGKAEVRIAVLRSNNCVLNGASGGALTPRIGNDKLNQWHNVGNIQIEISDVSPHTLLGDTEDLDGIMYEYDKYGDAKNHTVCGSPSLSIPWKSNDTKYGPFYTTGNNLNSTTNWEIETATWGNDGYRFRVRAYY